MAKKFMFVCVGVIALACAFAVGAMTGQASMASSDIAIGTGMIQHGQQIPLPFYSDVAHGYLDFFVPMSLLPGQDVTDADIELTPVPTIDLVLPDTLTVETCCGTSSLAPSDGWGENLHPERPRARAMCEGRSPGEILGLLELSYNERDIRLYQSLLHESYRFQFCDRDLEAAGVTAEAPWWWKAQDVEYADPMFSMHGVSLSADLPITSGWKACTDAETGLEGLCCIVRPIIVLMRDIGADPPLVYEAHDSAAQITLVENPPRSDCWQILVIREVLLETCEEGCRSWGSIKSMFR